MSIQEYIDELKNFQSLLLEYINNENEIELNLQELTNQISVLKVFENQYKLKMIINLILKIANNHYRGPNFFLKIEAILQILKESIIKYFTNTDIFTIFKSNKRILLFLNEEGIFQFNDQVVKKIIGKSKYLKAKYPEYFMPEIKKFENEEWFPKKTQFGIRRNDWVGFLSDNLPENFNENRKNGENDDHICKLIREDSIVDFISFVTKNSINLNSSINPSIYETNHFPKIKVENDKHSKVKLIEYSAFFGSLKIFNYLKMNEVELTPFLWQFAIHGNNANIIHLLEDLHVKIESNDLLFKEALKCHHNDIANYFLNNFLPTDESTLQIEFINCIKYYNFEFWEEKYVNESFFPYFCMYDYYLFVDLLMKNKCIDINKPLIQHENSRTALYLAVKKGNIDIIKFLLENEKIDLNIINVSHEMKNSSNNELEENWWVEKESYSSKFVIHEETVLFLAIEEGNNEIIKLLLENPKTDLNKISTVHYHVDKYQDDDKDDDKYEDTPLFLSMKKRNLDIFKLLLQNEKVDPNIMNKIYNIYTYETGGTEEEYECTVFYEAVYDGNLEFAKILIENEKVDPNIKAKGWFKDYDNGYYNNYEKAPIYAAAQRCIIEEDDSLLKFLVKSDKIDINILNKVVEKHSLDYFQGDKMEEDSNDKHTVLHYAANDKNRFIKNHIKLIKFLMSNKNIKISILDNHGERPIFYASNQEVIKGYYFFFFQNRYYLKKNSH